MPAVVGHCAELERRGVPTVAIATEAFAPLAKRHARLIGMPGIRIVYVPQPVSRIPYGRCCHYLQRIDPVTGQAITDQITEALTTLSSTECAPSWQAEVSAPRLLGPDTEENLHRVFSENGWTDGLPIVLPTEKRVSRMLQGTHHGRDEVVGELGSGNVAISFTVEMVAANAVMAGAKAEHLPVILALAASGIPAITSSTQSSATMIVVNGPIVKEIDMNAGCGALSPCNHANAVIGRAATLLAINLGAGGVPLETYWGTQGNNLDYNHVTFAENEDALPAGWKAFHVQKGFAEQESAVSFFHGYGMWHWKNTFGAQQHKAMLRLANWVTPSGAYQSGLGLLLDPLVAEELVSEGFSTKESLSQYIFENAVLTLEEFWQYHLVEGFSLPAAHKGTEPYATWLKQPGETLIKRYRHPDEISILVVGGRTNDFWQAGDWRYTGTFSIDRWR